MISYFTQVDNCFSSVAIPTYVIVAMILISLWTLVWKGLALYQASQRKEKIWFIILLIANTLGILEIIYLIIIRLKKSDPIINPLAPDHFAPPKNPNLP